MTNFNSRLLGPYISNPDNVPGTDDLAVSEMSLVAHPTVMQLYAKATDGQVLPVGVSYPDFNAAIAELILGDPLSSSGPAAVRSWLGVNTAVYQTVAAAAAANLSAMSSVLVIKYDTDSVVYPTPYVKVLSEPSHTLKFQDASGSWWEIGDVPLSPYHAGCTGSGDETTAVQSVLDLAQSRGSVFDGAGPSWPVTKLTISNGNNHFEMRGNTDFLAISESSQTALLEITRGNFSITGQVAANCSYRTNYAAGIWCHNNTQIQNIHLSRLIGVGALIGIRVGDKDHGSSITSEITLTEPRTYGCPIAVQVEGGNTFLAITAPPCMSADAFGGDTAWQARPRHALVNKGATVVITGGEVIQTGSGLSTDHLVDMQPSMFGSDLVWGRTTLIGSSCETAGPLAKIHNPDVLTGSSTNNDRPAFSVLSCNGYHSQDNAPFITASSDYAGDIRISNNNFWFPGTRTQKNISVGADCHVYVDDMGFGNGFLGPIAGTLGGIAHFSKRTIFEANGLPNTNLTSGLQTLKWQSFVPSDDHIRFQGYYSNTTGQFTVPAGGLKNVRISAQMYATGVTGYMVIRDGSTEIARGHFLNDCGSVSIEKTDVPEGTLISVDLYVSSGAGSPPSASGFLNVFTIEATN